MKNKTLSLALLCVLFLSSNVVIAETFENLENLTPAQIQQISKIQNSFKIKNNELETRISDYVNRIAQLRIDTQKTGEQIALLISAYERNIETLKNQQELLIKENESLYKSILTANQYKQYLDLQSKVQESFSNFLQK